MLNTSPTPPVIVVGGGITGLATAWELQKHQQQYILLERDARWGGKVITHHLPSAQERPFIIEGGPESFVARKPEVWQLALELGITDQVVGAKNEARNIFILTEGEPLELPLSPVKFLTSKLLSTRGKLRLFAEPFIKARRDDGDESIADFVTRRLGAEAHERMIGPILGGIYNTDTHEQSIFISSPIMREMERDFGGLVRGMFGRMKQKKAQRAQAEASGEPQAPASFITFANGSQTLTDALADQLTGDLRLNAQVIDVVALSDNTYEVVLADGERLLASAIIFTIPAPVTAKILAPVAPTASEDLSAIHHNNLGTISLIYRAENLANVLPFSGVMIPRREGRRIDAITWTSRKDRERTPEGYEILRVYYGGGDPETTTMSEADLLAVVQDELRDLLNIVATPEQYSIARWSNDYAQAPVGHLERVARIEANLPQGIYVAGASYRGLAVPDCIAQGQASAQQALTQLGVLA
jgi:oxygen-dependent protoporphyrinogen oxidase